MQISTARALVYMLLQLLPWSVVHGSTQRSKQRPNQCMGLLLAGSLAVCPLLYSHSDNSIVQQHAQRASATCCSGSYRLSQVGLSWQWLCHLQPLLPPSLGPSVRLFELQTQLLLPPWYTVPPVLQHWSGCHPGVAYCADCNWWRPASAQQTCWWDIQDSVYCKCNK